MNFASTTFSRREALLNVLKGTAAAVAAPLIIQAVPEVSSKAEAPFVPENDYPFFDFTPELALPLPQLHFA